MTKTVFRIVPCVGKAGKLSLCTGTSPLRGRVVGNRGSQKLHGQCNSQELFPK